MKTTKPTKATLPQQYIINAMGDLEMSGDAYVSDEQLYQHCCQDHSKLSISTFRQDKAVLLKKGLLHQEGRRLYRERIWKYENAAARVLSDILPHNDFADAVVPENLRVGDLPLTAQQRQAVSMALSHRLSLILGGAGTGKTTLIQAIVARRPRALPGYVLCAPTGKAARNLRDRTGLTARTVHSALGKQPEQDFLERVQWRFVGLVVIDEASMMTLEMLAGILSSAPRSAHVVLVGDPHQLLSVGAGNVLPDLLTLGIPHVLLTTPHRQSTDSAALSHNVRQFQSCHSFEDFQQDSSFQFLPRADDQDTMQTVCELGAACYRAGESVQVLSPFNTSGKLSAARLNFTMREMLNPATEENSLPALFFRDGDRVIILRNDWEQGVCNGDVGRFYLLSCADSDSIVFGVICDSGTRASMMASGAPSMLGLAYTITVHKSQGSEYDTVILPLSRQFSTMLYRNLLYTAISRAKKRVILVGDADAAEVALQREPPKRQSMLVQKTRMLQERSA